MREKNFREKFLSLNGVHLTAGRFDQLQNATVTS
jgi:hypothetical protein